MRAAQTAQLDIFDARSRRDAGMALVEDSQPVAWMQDAQRAIDQLIIEGDPFSADDVCRRVGRPLHCNAVGCFMRRAVQSDRLEMVGRVQSTRPAARGRWIPLYRGRRG